MNYLKMKNLFLYNIDDPDSDKDPLSKYIDKFVEYCY